MAEELLTGPDVPAAIQEVYQARVQRAFVVYHWCCLIVIVVIAV